MSTRGKTQVLPFTPSKSVWHSVDSLVFTEQSNSAVQSSLLGSFRLIINSKHRVTIIQALFPVLDTISLPNSQSTPMRRVLSPLSSVRKLESQTWRNALKSHGYTRSRTGTWAVSCVCTAGGPHQAARHHIASVSAQWTAPSSITGLKSDCLILKSSQCYCIQSERNMT